jgi:hypothetical protein
MLGFLYGILFGTNVSAFTLNVVDDAGSAVPNYEWTVQEDNTYDAVANVGIKGNPNALSTSIHKSHAHVLAVGSTPVVDLPATGRYYISAKAPGYTLNGDMVKMGQTSVTVLLHKNPIPMAQVSVLVFEDNAPINGAPDIPGERTLPNFKVYIYDQLGQMSTDGFGNPIGTIYEQNLDSNGDAVVKTTGAGYVITTTAGDGTTGNALIPNLAPGKYGIRAVPNDGKPWVQTATIEGTPGIDAWVMAGEPPYNTEAGFFGVHAFIGFVLPTSYYKGLVPPDTTTNQFRTLLSGETYGTITGQVMINHQNRPPLQAGFIPSIPVPEAYVGLTDTGNGNTQVYVAKCNPDSTFTIANVPPGTYTLVLWDFPLDMVIDFRTVVIPPAGGTVNMGQIPLTAWFGRYETSIFNDLNKNGVRDAGEAGIPNQLVDFRFRDGSMYLLFNTDNKGEFVFTEVFPFFKYIIAESDYTRFKPTGATVYVDKGGPMASPWPNPVFPLMETRTDTGPFPFLLEGMMLYNGSNAKIDWGRTPYAPGENGGIVGVAYYAVTRAQADPRLSVAEPWEPGIPDVTINLYKVTGYDSNGKPLTQGPINTYQTDSWDKSLPTGCKAAMTAAGLPLNPQGIPMDTYIDCAETIPFWNQIKPAVFDGGYAFSTDAQGNPLPAGDYVVEAIIPPGYILEKEEDVNAIVQGDTYTPSVPQPALLPAECVGADHLVPAFHSSDSGPNGIPPGSPIDIDSGSPVLPYVGQTRPLCDKKLVRLADGQNAAADFHIWTRVPPAGRIVGLVTDDLTPEFRRRSPRLNDVIGVPFIPISFQDYTGHEVARTYSDEWGQYNALIPSSYSVNVALPTGVSPNIVQIVVNHPGFNPAHPDPYFNPGYPTVSVEMDVWSGKTTYADTPLIPIRPNFSTLDCDLPDKTPMVFEVNGPAGGPWVEATPGTVTITSVGKQLLSDTSTRDYGFGSSEGNVFATPVGSPVDSMSTLKLQILSWADGSISLTGKLEDGVTPLPNGEYQLTVRREDSRRMSIAAATLHVGVPASKVKRVTPGAGAIQSAIDSAADGDLILIAPGLYPENIIMYKNVKLQGYGAASTVINAGFFTPDKQTTWLALLNSITTAQTSTFYIIPGEQPDFFLEQGAGIMVLAREGDFTDVPDVDHARIDGLTITGANLGGGIFVNGFAHYLQITNNKLIANQGTVGGGIRIGTPSLVSPGTQAGTSFYESSHNDNITISNNQLVTNGSNGQTIASGGGIGLFTGSDNYVVSDSWICGNFSALAGAGIGQQGLSDHGVIRNNTIIFNQSFDEGGGIFLSGETPIAGLVSDVNGTRLLPVTTPLLSAGAGNAVIYDNLIQGNKGGNIGGGITLFNYNGLDVLSNPSNPTAWYKAEIYNNLIVNNLSGAYGAGIAIFNALDTIVVNNTISNNDTTATSEFAFGVIPNNLPNPTGLVDIVLPSTAITLPMPSGIGVQPFSGDLRSAMSASFYDAYGEFGGTITPVLVNNIITNNFAYFWNGYDPQNSLAALSLAGVWDMGVFGSAAKLNPRSSLLTNATGYDPSNISGDPKFMTSYRNNINASQGGSALGNFVNYIYTPMTLVGNYHLKRLSPALDSGDVAALSTWDPLGSYLPYDIDSESRPMGYTVPAKPDMGADELNSKGDVNCDGSVTMQDALLTLRYVVDNAQTLACPQNGDAAPLTPTGKPIGNGVTNLSDVLAILMRAMGMTTW